MTGGADLAILGLRACAFRSAGCNKSAAGHATRRQLRSVVLPNLAAMPNMRSGCPTCAVGLPNMRRATRTRPAYAPRARVSRDTAVGPRRGDSSRGIVFGVARREHGGAMRCDAGSQAPQLLSGMIVRIGCGFVGRARVLAGPSGLR